MTNKGCLCFQEKEREGGTLESARVEGDPVTAIKSEDAILEGREPRSINDMTIPLLQLVQQLLR